MTKKLSFVDILHFHILIDGTSIESYLIKWGTVSLIARKQTMYRS